MLSNEVMLPKVVVKLWKPVLKLLHVLEMTPALLHFIMAQLTEEKDLPNRLRFGWLAVILTSLLSLGQSIQALLLLRMHVHILIEINMLF